MRSVKQGNLRGMLLGAVVTVLGVAGVGTGAEAAVMNLDTGTAAWELTAVTSNDPGSTSTLSAVETDVNSAWLAESNFAGAKWIGPRSNSDDVGYDSASPVNDFSDVYQYKLELTGVKTGVRVSGEFASDNGAQLLLDGVEIARSGDPDDGTTDPFQLPKTSFNTTTSSADQTLTINVVNLPNSGTGNNPTGVILDGTAVPAPAALPGGLALLGMLGVGRHRRRRAA